MAGSSQQSIGISINNRIKPNAVIRVQNAKIIWGKYVDGSGHEISPNEVDKITIDFGSKESVNARSREDSPLGTEGDFDLYDGETKICNVYWNCPWGQQSNDIEIRDCDPETSPYAILVGPWHRGSGPIGDVNLTVSLVS